MYERHIPMRPKRRGTPTAEGSLRDGPSSATQGTADDRAMDAPGAPFDFGRIGIAPPQPQIGPEGGAVSPDLAERIHARQGDGASLEPAVRQKMEAGFGHNFADVRVHADGEATALSRSMGASAFTLGSDIFLGREAASAGADSGDHVLAHELTHVVQQRGMPTDGPLTVGPMSDGYEREAHVAARQATADGGLPGAAPMAGLASVGGAGAVVQRAPVDMPNEKIDVHPPKNVDMEGETLIKPHAGQTPSGLIGARLGHMEDAIGMFWQNYRSGLDNFQTTLQFESQETETDLLALTFRGVLKGCLDAAFSAAAKAAVAYSSWLIVAKGIATTVADKFADQHGSGSSEIVKFINDARKEIGPAEMEMKKGIAQLLDPLSSRYDELAKQDAKSREKAEGDILSGASAEMIARLGDAANEMEREIRETRSADYFQERFTEQFAHIGKSQVGPVAEGLHANGSLELELSVAQNEHNRYHLKSGGDAWTLMTNAPEHVRVGKSLEASLAGQGKFPYQSALWKVVHVSIEMDEGPDKDFNFSFQNIGDALNNVRGHFPDHNPAVVAEIWDTLVREKITTTKGVKASNG